MTSILCRQELKQLPINFKILFKGYSNFVSDSEEPLEYTWGLFKNFCRFNYIGFDGELVQKIGNYPKSYIDEFVYVTFELMYFGKPLCLKESFEHFDNLFDVSDKNYVNVYITSESSLFSKELLDEWRAWYLYGNVVFAINCKNDIRSKWDSFFKYWDLKNYKYLNMYISYKFYHDLNFIRQFETEIANDSLLIQEHYQKFISKKIKYYSEIFNYNTALPIFVQSQIVNEYKTTTSKKSFKKIIKKQKNY